MSIGDLITIIKLPFVKQRGLYDFLHEATGYWPHDIEPYRLALVHRSKPVRDAAGNWVNNERLEYLGDAVFDLVVADFLYSNYPDSSEGFLTSTRAKIVQRESLNRIGHDMGIDGHVQCGVHSSSHNSYIAGNALEAIVGALYIDRGFHAARSFIIERMIKRHFDLDKLISVDRNYKSRLIEWTQKFRVTIEWELLDTILDENGNPTFKTGVTLGGQFAADGLGYSKKESHQVAAQAALARLEADKQFLDAVLHTAVM